VECEKDTGYIEEQKDIQFDPQVVELLLEIDQE
jgi:response regulator RpfG family c-di-GMP phosphodiesterase